MALAQGRDIAFCTTCVVVLVAAFCCSTASATVWTVGDARGWNVSVDYTAWATGKTFVVGDVLFFPYELGRHDVVVVNKSEHDACAILLSDLTFTAGNTSIPLNKTGSSYYLCSFPQHCALGMKLAVNVVSAAASAPGPTSPSPSPAPVTAPTPSPASTATPTPSPASVATPTPSPSSTATPTPSPSSTATPTPSPASSPTTAPTPSPASPTTSSPASTPTGATTPSPSSTNTTSPPAPITPSAPPPNSAPRVQAAIGGAVVLWTLLGSTLLML